MRICAIYFNSGVRNIKKPAQGYNTKTFFCSTRSRYPSSVGSPSGDSNIGVLFFIKVSMFLRVNGGSYPSSRTSIVTIEPLMPPSLLSSLRRNIIPSRSGIPNCFTPRFKSRLVATFISFGAISPDGVGAADAVAFGAEALVGAADVIAAVGVAFVEGVAA